MDLSNCSPKERKAEDRLHRGCPGMGVTFALAAALLAAVTLLAAASVPAKAGVNQDGRIVLHAVKDISMTRDGEDRNLRNCEAAVSSLPGDDSAVIIFALAAFPDWVSPRMTGVVFGINYDTTVISSGIGFEMAFQLPTSDWPGPGSGIAVTRGNLGPITDRLTTLYWFATYAYQGATFEVIENPVQGLAFADDSTPAVLDDIRSDDLGKIGFGVPGYNPCLANVATGGCCFDTGVCTINAEVACEDDEGTYLGDDTGCDPFACVGACCFQGDCSQERPEDCERIGGWFRGVALGCGNTACLSEDVTWGELKRSYRRDYP